MSPSRRLSALAAAAPLVALAALCACGDAGADAWARARARLAAGDPAGAAQAAGEAEKDDPGRFGPHAAFLRASAAWARSEAAETAAAQPGADPALFARALADAEDALAGWRAAAATRPDWPQARRNAERALLRLERLRERGSEGGAKPSEPKPPPPTPPPPAPPSLPEGTARPPERDPAAGDLSPEEVARLLEVLGAKEREKQDLRRAERAAGMGGVERDW